MSRQRITTKEHRRIEELEAEEAELSEEGSSLVEELRSIKENIRNGNGKRSSIPPPPVSFPIPEPKPSR